MTRQVDPSRDSGDASLLPTIGGRPVPETDPDPSRPQLAVLRAHAAELEGPALFDLLSREDRRMSRAVVVAMVVTAALAAGLHAVGAGRAAEILAITVVLDVLLLLILRWGRGDVTAARTRAEEGGADRWVTVQVHVHHPPPDARATASSTSFLRVWDRVLPVSERAAPSRPPDAMLTTSPVFDGWLGWDAVPARTRGDLCDRSTFRPLVGAPVVAQPNRGHVELESLVPDRVQPGVPMLATSGSVVRVLAMLAANASIAASVRVVV